MNIRSGGLLLACAVFLLAASPSPVLAQDQPIGDKKKALDLYDKAKIQYDLGHWDQAITLWVQAYETFNAPEFLFNIAQAYRQSGNCERALFFYRRYLATKPNAKNRPEVEGIMKELEGTCSKGSGPGTAGKSTSPGKSTAPGKSTTEGGKSPGMSAAPAPGGSGTVSTQTDPDADTTTSGRGPDVADTTGDVIDGDDGVAYEGTLSAPARPRYFAVRAAAGPSFPDFGRLNVDVLSTFSLGGGHPLYVGKFVLEPGALITYTPVPWEVERPTEETPLTGTAGLIGLLANLGVSYEFIPKLSGRADVGIGALLFTGLSVDGNPFLQMGYDLDKGAVSLFATRIALGAEYAITPNFVIHAQPAVLSWSPSRPLGDGIENIIRFEMLVGAGYQM